MRCLALVGSRLWMYVYNQVQRWHFARRLGYSKGTGCTSAFATQGGTFQNLMQHILGDQQSQSLLL